jgi:hypothetical protein
MELSLHTGGVKGGMDKMKEVYGRGEFKDFIARPNFKNPKQMYVFGGVQLLLAFMFLSMALPATAGKYPYAKLDFEIRDAVLDILKKYGMPVARDRETPWLAIDGRPGHYSIIFHRADEIPQGVVLETVKLCMDMYQKQGLKEHLESIRILIYRESKEEWRKSLFLGIGTLTTVKPFFELTIGRK